MYDKTKTKLEILEKLKRNMSEWKVILYDYEYDLNDENSNS